MVLAFMKARRIELVDISKYPLIFGDWGMFGKAQSGNHSTKGSGLMDIFRRWGFWCFYVWEFRTSLSCSNCKTRNATTKYCKKVFDPKRRRNRQPLRGTVPRTCHGLVKCTECKETWNRDLNGARNIWRVVYNAIKGKNNEVGVTDGNKYRPADLRRL